MSAFTIKKFPKALLAKLQESAVAARRSVTQEVLVRLEISLEGGGNPAHAADAPTEAERQVAAWRKLAGKWQSDLTIDEEIAQLYRARTRGRKVEL